MARLSKSERQDIVRDFASRHDGVYDPATFVAEVAADDDHAARDWFTWNKDKAALEYQVWQAREFVVGLKIRFTVEEVRRSGKMKIVVREMPFAISPVQNHGDGGGYFVVDPENPEHMAEHCRQAAVSLQRWINRFDGALSHLGGSVSNMEKTIRLLESVSEARSVEVARVAAKSRPRIVTPKPGRRGAGQADDRPAA